MKKIFLTALVFALCGNAYAETIELTEDGKLAEAVSSAAEGDVIVLKADQTISSRLAFSNKKNLVVKGATGSERIVRAAEGWSGNQTMLLYNDASVVTMQNLVLDGNNVSTTTFAVEVGGQNSQQAKATFDNVTFSHFNVNKKDDGILHTSWHGNMIFVDCSFVENTLAQGTYDILADNHRVWIGGRTSAGIVLRKGFNYAPSIIVDEAVTGKPYTGNCTLSTISTYTDIDGTIFVEGATSGFSLKNLPPYELVADGNNLKVVLKDTSDKAIVNQNTYNGYDTLEDALAALGENEEGVLLIQKSINVNSAINNPNGKKLVIKGAGDGIVLTKTFNNGFMVNGSADLNLENLTLDENNLPNNRGVVNVPNNKSVSLTNVKFVNSNCGWELILAGRGRILLNNVFYENCNTQKPMVKFSDRLLIQGDTNLKLRAGGKDFNITVNGELTNNEPIAIDFEKPDYEPAKDGSRVVVYNCTDPDRFSVPEGFTLAAKDGNLVAGSDQSTAVAPIDVDTFNAPVEYFNLQGMKVQNPVNGQIYIERQGSKTRKVMF